MSSLESKERGEYAQMDKRNGPKRPLMYQFDDDPYCKAHTISRSCSHSQPKRRREDIPPPLYAPPHVPSPLPAYIPSPVSAFTHLPVSAFVPSTLSAFTPPPVPALVPPPVPSFESALMLPPEPAQFAAEQREAISRMNYIIRTLEFEEIERNLSAEFEEFNLAQKRRLALAEEIAPTRMPSNPDELGFYLACLYQKKVNERLSQSRMTPSPLKDNFPSSPTIKDETDEKVVRSSSQEFVTKTEFRTGNIYTTITTVNIWQ